MVAGERVYSLDGMCRAQEPVLVDVAREREKLKASRRGRRSQSIPQRHSYALFPQSTGPECRCSASRNRSSACRWEAECLVSMRRVLAKHVPEAAKCPDVGFPGKPALEIIVGLKPDLILIPYFHQSVRADVRTP